MTIAEMLMLYAIVLALVGNGIMLCKIHKVLWELLDMVEGEDDEHQ